MFLDSNIFPNKTVICTYEEKRIIAPALFSYSFNLQTKDISLHILGRLNLSQTYGQNIYRKDSN